MMLTRLKVLLRFRPMRMPSRFSLPFLKKTPVIRTFFANRTIVKLGDPLPGYSGTNRRVVADNLFGLTYGDAKRKAQESQKKVEGYQSELLKKTSAMKPGYKWAQ